MQIASRHVTAAEELAARNAAAADAAVVLVVVVVLIFFGGRFGGPARADEPLASPCPSEAEAPAYGAESR